jgi:hypothetical protein
MKKPLVVMLICGPLTLVLLGLLAVHDKLPVPVITEHVLPHAAVGIFITFLVALVAWLIGEYLERFDPVIEKAFERISADMRQGIEGSLIKMNTTIADGFNSVASALAKEVRGVSESWRKGLSDTHVQQDLLATVNSPQVKRLIAAGQINEAIAKLDDILVKDQAQLREQIAVLLLSANEKDWVKAVEILDQNEDVQEPKFFLTLAYRFWSVKKLEDAIKLGEKGLSLVEEKDSLLRSRFENSLAYYYADAESPDKETTARHYAEAAVKSRPGEPGPLDTLGFVLISYGKTREEILKGVEYCNEALRLGGGFELYTKHIVRANSRLQSRNDRNAPQ